MKKDKWEWQGKTKEQVQFSEFMAMMGMLFFICGILFAVIWKLLS
tara:strand:+ start:333 stop:467 length:135 start_codon:yes stop_codon:yes gene_type:complete